MGLDRDLQVKVPWLEMQVCLKVLGEGEMKGIVFETTVPWLYTKSGTGRVLCLIWGKSIRDRRINQNRVLKGESI